MGLQGLGIVWCLGCACSALMLGAAASLQRQGVTQRCSCVLMQAHAAVHMVPAPPPRWLQRLNLCVPARHCMQCARADSPAAAKHGAAAAPPASPAARSRQHQLQHLRQQREQQQAAREARCLSGDGSKAAGGKKAAGGGAAAVAARHKHNAGVKATAQVQRGRPPARSGSLLCCACAACLPPHPSHARCSMCKHTRMC